MAGLSHRDSLDGGGLVSLSEETASTRLPIERIETIPLRVPLVRTYKGSAYRMTHRSTLIVRVMTAAGVVGEAYVGDEDATLVDIDRILREEIAPLVIGVDAFAIERLWQLARPTTFDILRDRRLSLVACAALDTAVWDAIGKQLGEPLWRLWGGYRNELQMISIGGYYSENANIQGEIDDLRTRGMAGMKFKVGGLTPEEDAVRFKEARRAAGPDFVLMADANQAWSTRDAIRFAQLVADDDLYWFEEPCQWHNDHRSMRDVRNAVGVRVCAGQSEHSAAGCRNLMESGAIDVCNFDASWSGGPTEWRRVAAAALAYDVVMGHHEEPQVAAHLLGSIPHGTFVECFHPDRDPIWWSLVANRPSLADGVFRLTDAPGLGWELDEDFIVKYKINFQ